MKLYTIEKNEKELVAVEGKDGRLVALESLGVVVADMNDLICRYDELKLSILEKMAGADGLEPGAYTIKAPIPVPLQDVVCLGVNYRDHMEETKNMIDFTKKADTVYFSKRVSRSNDPGGVIPVYDFVDGLDYEVELGVVLKKDAFGVAIEEAYNYVLGYTIVNDVTARDVQKKHQQWYLGKSLDGYTPIGPCIVTADEIQDPMNLGIRCYVNDELRQNGNTNCMITSVSEAIAELSQGMTLKAGTIIATGTPSGVGAAMNPPRSLVKGDVVRCEVEGIGELVNYVG